ncbi:MAG: hypothetical protein Q9226_000761 [Calogaya cf. arnoldii]
MHASKAAKIALEFTDLGKAFQGLAVAGNRGETTVHRQKSNEATIKNIEANNAGQNDDSVQLYEVKATGSKGLGVFAIRDIPRGTRIMAERPLLLCNNGFSEVLIAFCKISVEDQRKFLALSDHKTEDWKARYKRKVQRKIRGSHESDPDVAALTVEQQVNILEIFFTNCFGAGENPTDVVCDDACRINHSCLPNVYHRWNEQLGRLTIHANWDIPAGKEIVTTYIEICRDRAQRQFDLLPWGFQCDCQACDGSTEFGQASDRRRKRLRELEHNNTLETRFESRDLWQFVIECMDLLREEEVEDREMKRNYATAAELHEKLGNLEKAYEWQEKVVEQIATCAGTDHDRYHEAQAKLQDLRRQLGRQLEAGSKKH